MKLARPLRSAAALVATLAITLGPATALADFSESPANEGTSPPVFDLLILRPLGIIGCGVSTMLFVVPVAPITLLTRPGDIATPFDRMVVQPALYVIADPLGEH